MAGRIEDHALIGDMQTAALAGKDGSIDLSEEYDPRYGRQVGNTPQTFSHVPLIQAALNLAAHEPDHCRRPAGRTETECGQR